MQTFPANPLIGNGCRTEKPANPRRRVSSYELHVLIEALASRACLATDNPETIDVADRWFDRAAELREAAL